MTQCFKREIESEVRESTSLSKHYVILAITKESQRKASLSLGDGVIQLPGVPVVVVNTRSLICRSFLRLDNRSSRRLIAHTIESYPYKGVLEKEDPETSTGPGPA